MLTTSNTIFLFVISTLSANLLCIEKEVVIGIVEDHSEICAKSFVRLSFVKKENRWEPYCKKNVLESCMTLDLRSKGKWYFAGRDKEAINTALSKTSITSDYKNLGLFSSEPSLRIPENGPKDEKYGGFLHEPRLKPQVITSPFPTLIKEGWSKSEIPVSVVRLAQKEWREVFGPSLEACEVDDLSSPKFHRINYQDSDLELIESYTSKTEGHLVKLQMTEKYYKCVEMPPKERSPQWFYVSEKMEARHILFSKWYKEFVTDVDFLDSGDYDNDGKNEVIFMLHSYNEDGYVLASDSFKSTAIFTWNYH